jgi:hypothetical protein
MRKGMQNHVRVLTRRMECMMKRIWNWTMKIPAAATEGT